MSATATATITAVNTNKAVVLFSGLTTKSDDFSYFTHLTLTNSTTVTATRFVTSATENTVPYQVIEYY